MPLTNENLKKAPASPSKDEHRPIKRACRRLIDPCTDPALAGAPSTSGNDAGTARLVQSSLDRMRGRSDSLEAWADREMDVVDLPPFLRTRPDLLKAITFAFKKIGEKKLRRSNRADLLHLDDDSLDGNRKKIDELVLREEVGFMTMARAQQRSAHARAVAEFYEANPDTEAFCGETAVLFLAYVEETNSALTQSFFKIALTECELDEDFLVSRENGDTHSFILYTESAAVKTHIRDDYNDEFANESAIDFSELLFDHKDSCLILDPWGTEKVIDISELADMESVVQKIRAMAHRANLKWAGDDEGALIHAHEINQADAY